MRQRSASQAFAQSNEGVAQSVAVGKKRREGHNETRYENSREHTAGESGPSFLRSNPLQQRFESGVGLPRSIRNELLETGEARFRWCKGSFPVYGNEGRLAYPIADLFAGLWGKVREA